MKELLIKGANMERFYSSNHTSYVNSKVDVSARTTNDFNIWLNIDASAYNGEDYPSYYAVQTFNLTISQARDIIEALSDAVAEYDEAIALAQFEAERDSENV